MYDDHLNTDRHGIQVSLSKKNSSEFTVRNKGNLATIIYFKIYCCKDYINFYIYYDSSTKKKNQEEASFTYDFTYRPFSKVYREFFKKVKPFQDQKNDLHKKNEEAKKAKLENKCNNTIATIFPNIVDDILLGDKDDTSK